VSLTVVRRRRSKFVFVSCSNGCRDPRLKGKNLGFRSASYDAVILGIDIPLCSSCAKEWPRIWDEALEQSEDRELVPA
jgi:hypothetical protein